MKELNQKGFFTNDDGSDAFITETDPKRKFGLDVVLPKYPMTAFTLFSKENTSKLMK